MIQNLLNVPSHVGTMNCPFWVIISFRFNSILVKKNFRIIKILTTCNCHYFVYVKKKIAVLWLGWNVGFAHAWCCTFLWFSQDSFGRLHDRGKEVPKATKLLTKLFPNKVTIHMPQVYKKGCYGFSYPFLEINFKLSFSNGRMRAFLYHGSTS